MPKMLITKIVRKGSTVELYAKGHRYRDTILFDASELSTVGIDYQNLADGTEVPTRFWCTYELSSKLNADGNPYKDVVALEPDNPTKNNHANGQELAAIKALLLTLTDQIAEIHRYTVPPRTSQPAAPTYNDGTPVDTSCQPETTAYNHYTNEHGQPPDSRDALRQWVLANNPRK